MSMSPDTSGPADDEPFVHPSGPILASYLIRVTVHALDGAEPLAPPPGLRDIRDLVKYQFESLTGCPVGVKAERVDK